MNLFTVEKKGARSGLRPSLATRAFLATALMAAGIHAEVAPVASVPLFNREDSLILASGKFRIAHVVDLRRLGRENPRMLGAGSVGPFGKQTWIWADNAVDESVAKQLRRWFPDSGSAKAIPLDIEITSFECWSVRTTNPHSSKAVVRLRVLVGDPSLHGLAVENSSVREGPCIPDSQAGQLRTCLRKAMEQFLQEDWAHSPPVNDVGMPGPDPDPWTNALKPSTVRPAPMSRTLVHVSETMGMAGQGFGMRMIFYHEPQAGQNPEFWLNVRLRDPQEPNYTSWVGEVSGGKGYQYRMGESQIVMAEQMGIVIGMEKFRYNGGKLDHWKYVGFEIRSGGRWEPEGFEGLSGEAGIHGALRVPSTLQVFDFGFYVEAGWRF
jgi:hypothetical protein